MLHTKNCIVLNNMLSTEDSGEPKFYPVSTKDSIEAQNDLTKMLSSEEKERKK